MAPKYERPAAPIPARSPGGAGQREGRRRSRGRAFVREPKLRQILAHVVAQNRSLRRAAARHRVARAQLYRMQRAGRLPVDRCDRSASDRARQFIGMPGEETITITASTTRPRSGSRAGRSICSAGSRACPTRSCSSIWRAPRPRKAARITLIAETATGVRHARRRPQPARDRARHDGDVASARWTSPSSSSAAARRTARDFCQAATVFQQARARRRVADRGDRARPRRARAARRRSRSTTRCLPDALPDAARLVRRRPGRDVVGRAARLAPTCSRRSTS